MENIETIKNFFSCSHCQTKNRVIVRHRVFFMSMYNRYLLRCCQATVSVSVVDVNDEALTIDWSGKTDVITKSRGARLHIESCAYDCHGWIELDIKM